MNDEMMKQMSHTMGQGMGMMNHPVAKGAMIAATAVAIDGRVHANVSIEAASSSHCRLDQHCVGGCVCDVRGRQRVVVAAIGGSARDGAGHARRINSGGVGHVTCLQISPRASIGDYVLQ